MEQKAPFRVNTMTDQGKDPRDQDLDLIPAIAPEKDELDSRRRNLSAPRQSNFRGLLVFCLVIMGVVLSIGGYTLYEVQQRLNQSNELLDQANKGVADLEARLAATGTDVSKELQTLKEQQATNFSEIDKLWRVAYRENRPNIKKLESSFKDMATTNEKLSTDIIALRSQVKESAGAFKSLSDTMNQTRENLLADNEELKTSISLVRGQVQDQGVQAEATKRSLAALEQDLKEVQEAINAIDRYRQQINQRLLQLENTGGGGAVGG
jgi:chromosome segregation ATPase